MVRVVGGLDVLFAIARPLARRGPDLNARNVRDSEESIEESSVHMGFIAWIVLGLIAGVIAKSLGGRVKHGVIVTILVGIAGALFGGWAASKVFHIETAGGFFDLSIWIIAIIGSVVLLLIYHAVIGGMFSHPEHPRDRTSES